MAASKLIKNLKSKRNPRMYNSTLVMKVMSVPIQTADMSTL